MSCKTAEASSRMRWGRDVHLIQDRVRKRYLHQLIIHIVGERNLTQRKAEKKKVEPKREEEALK